MRARSPAIPRLPALVVMVVLASAAPVRHSPIHAAQPLPADTGIVVIDGAYLTPPFAVELRNGDIVINGVVAREYPLGGVSPAEAPAAEPQSATDLSEVAGIVYRALGREPSPANRAALMDLLRSYPATATVSDESDALLVTDTAGGQALIPLHYHPEMTPEQAQREQQEYVESWRALLAAGGALLIGANAIAEYPPARAADLADDLAAAARLPEHQRHGYLTMVLNDAPLAGLMAQAILPSSATKRLATSERNHHSARTARTRKAYLFVTQGLPFDTTSVKRAAALHGYTSFTYEQKRCKAGNTDVRAVTYERFFQTSGQAAMLYIGSHGAQATNSDGTRSHGLDLEEFCSKAERDAALAAYQAKASADPNYPVPVDSLFPGIKTPSIALDEEGIAGRWKDANTIVHINSCWAGNMAASFKAREYIGPPELIDRCTGLFANASLWDRIAGIEDTGMNRSAGDAFNASDFKTHKYIYTPTYDPGEHDPGTVLSPAAVRTGQRDGTAYTAASEWTTAVRFDAAMDGSADPFQASLLTVDALLTGSCNPEITGARWEDSYTLVFTWKAKLPGKATFRIHNAKAISADNKAELDGNQGGRGEKGRLFGLKYDRGTNHVDGNGDDYVWSEQCISPVTEEPPAPAPTSSPSPSATPGSTGARPLHGAHFTPGQARPGEPVQFVAGPFTPGQRADVIVQDMLATVVPVDERGEVRGIFVVPLVPPGVAQVVIRTRIDDPVVSTFLVLPGPGFAPTPAARAASLTLAPAQGRPGMPFTVSITGLTAGAAVRTCWVSAIGTCAVLLHAGVVGSDGSVSFSTSVPLVPPGPYQIDATDDRGGRAAAGFTVLP